MWVGFSVPCRRRRFRPHTANAPLKSTRHANAMRTARPALERCNSVRQVLLSPINVSYETGACRRLRPKHPKTRWCGAPYMNGRERVPAMVVGVGCPIKDDDGQRVGAKAARVSKCVRPVIRLHYPATRLTEESPPTAVTRSTGRQQVSHFRLQLLHLFTGTFTPCARQPCQLLRKRPSCRHGPGAGSLEETLKTNSSQVE